MAHTDTYTYRHNKQNTNLIKIESNETIMIKELQKVSFQ